MKQPSDVKTPDDRSFGLLFGVVSGVLAAWMAWKGREGVAFLLVLALSFFFAAFVVPKILHPLNVAWMHFGLLLNRIVSPLVMGVMFFGLLTPIAVVMRWRGRDVLRRKFDPTLASYWIARRPPGPEGSSFPRQF